MNLFHLEINITARDYFSKFAKNTVIIHFNLGIFGWRYKVASNSLKILILSCVKTKCNDALCVDSLVRASTRINLIPKEKHAWDASIIKREGEEWRRERSLRYWETERRPRTNSIEDNLAQRGYNPCCWEICKLDRWNSHDVYIM